ncbi:hypothetical protein [Streptomyces sp. NPDC057287]|uniref:hypothetical protein n=1 Tax=Streptomyces sp. NPDC057287 TaxID=3346086 RepID=UPI003626054A
MERFRTDIEGIARRLSRSMAGGVPSFPLNGFRDGPVRAQLADPGPADLADLEKNLDAGRDLVGAPRRRTA